MVLEDGTVLDSRDGRRWGADPEGVPWAAAAYGTLRLYAYGGGRLVTAQGSDLRPDQVVTRAERIKIVLDILAAVVR